MMKVLLSRQSPASPQQLIIHALLLIAAFITLFPFYWMVITTFKTPAVSKAPIFTFMRNGLIVCFGVLACQLLVAIPTGWALARYDFRGKKLLFLIVLLGLAVPIQAPAIPLFIALATFDLLDTFFALMFPFFLSVFAIFLFRQAFKTFPDDIVLAARLDGMKEWEILWRVATPSIKPQIAAFAVFTFIGRSS